MSKSVADTGSLYDRAYLDASSKICFPRGLSEVFSKQVSLEMDEKANQLLIRLPSNEEFSYEDEEKPKGRHRGKFNKPTLTTKHKIDVRGRKSGKIIFLPDEVKKVLDRNDVQLSRYYSVILESKSSGSVLTINLNKPI